MLRIILRSRTTELHCQLKHYLSRTVPTSTWSFSTVPRSVRLVDITLWCVGSISTRHAWKWNRSIRVNILQKQDGCSSVSCLQPCCSRFFMGIYLGLLAVVDASTLGEFRMYAIPWQTSAGCQLAGFLGVLSSELSVYTLAVITLERNYAITHAMHLNKRLSLKHAGYIMTVGWCFALSMASLPLIGVSDYRKFAICLPFETNGNAALAYVIFLMLINGVAFLILMGCYLKMYCAIRGSQAWNSNDSRIAKRMALLVFTDFLCWSPIAFFSLTATFGLQLVSLEQAKVFAVFVLPLNSCCNPFLYAILTKQFKKDCVLICKAIEESRVTRGIGRCRHSSNFSNRQTPVNTNSLVDRSSRENQTPCACNSRLLETSQCSGYRRWGTRILWPCARDTRPRHARSDQYAYQIAEIQQKQHKRASSVSSSENFSSSRSDSWRQTHHCGIPLRLLDPKRRASSWLITRKPSQDSNLSLPEMILPVPQPLPAPVLGEFRGLAPPLR